VPSLRGTTAALFLTAATEAPLQEPAQPTLLPKRPHAVARTTVLVAEDDERVREVAVEMLRDSGFRMMAAQDALQALALLDRPEHADILFSDIVMPGGMTRIELAREAKHRRPMPPVLLATGYAGPAEGSTDHGFEVLAKPYD
jgi:CheY-like chemotaxis protein